MYLVYTIPPHFHKTIELQYIVEGDYRVTIRDESVLVPQGNILVIPPYVTHDALSQPNVKTILIMIPFEDFTYFSAFTRSTKPYLIFGDVAYNSETILPVLELLLSLETPTPPPAEFSDRALSALPAAIDIGWTNLIYGTLFSHYRPQFIGQETLVDSFDCILAYIDKNCVNPELSLSIIASKFSYNPSYFSRLFKKVFSTPLNKYINQVRVKKFIDRYNSDPSQNILSLALECGFNSQATFHRAFFEYTKNSPSKYFEAGNK